MTPGNMLDSRWNETRGYQCAPKASDFRQDSKDCVIADLRSSGYIQVMHKKNTVKELLMMRRQKYNGQHEDNDFEPKCKYSKPEPAYDVRGTPPPLKPNIIDFPPPAADYGHVAPAQMQHPTLQAPNSEFRMTLFHWQVQQEAQRLENISPEMLNMQDADGDTYLHIAVAQSRRALAYVLADKMARCGSLDMREHNGQTALQIAAATNQHLIIHDLVSHGAQINTQDLWGRSPLHVCAEKGYYRSLQSIWRTLIGSGQTIDIEMFNYDGLTPLHTAVLAHNAIIKELRTLENVCSYMKMELAQRRQMYVECMKTLLVMGASYGTKDLKSGRTCLHMASEEANVELFQLFLDSSSLSLVNIKTFGGNTALHIVSSLQNHKSQVEAVKLLLRKGADPGTRNFENELPSQLVPEGPTGEKIRHILKGKHVHA